MGIQNLTAGFAATSAIAGILGAAAMGLVMYLITRARWAHANMVVAVGSLFTRTRRNSVGVGTLVHCISAVGFAVLYNFALVSFGLAHFPVAFFAGIGFGIAHGMIVSLMLVWVVSERHPLEEFQDAGFAIGLAHFAGHVAYGAMVGLVIGVASMI